LPGRLRIDWPKVLRSAGFTSIKMQAQPEWHDLFTRVYRVALDLGEPDDGAPLATLQAEARRQLPWADLVHRVTITATTHNRPQIRGTRVSSSA
jgi:hypothetical protein